MFEFSLINEANWDGEWDGHNPELEPHLFWDAVSRVLGDGALVREGETDSHLWKTPDFDVYFEVTEKGRGIILGLDVLLVSREGGLAPDALRDVTRKLLALAEATGLRLYSHAHDAFLTEGDIAEWTPAGPDFASAGETLASTEGALLMPLVRKAVDHAIASLDDGGPLAPFVMTFAGFEAQRLTADRLVDKRPAHERVRTDLRRFPAETPEEGVAKARHALFHLPEEVLAYALVFEGYTQTGDDGEQEDAIVVEAAERGQPNGFLFVQPHLPATGERKLGSQLHTHGVTENAFHAAHFHAAPRFGGHEKKESGPALYWTRVAYYAIGAVALIILAFRWVGDKEEAGAVPRPTPSGYSAPRTVPAASSSPHAASSPHDAPSEAVYIPLSVDAQYTVHRGELPDNAGVRSLTWVIRENGVTVLERNAEKELSYRYYAMKPGSEYTVHLKAYYAGAYHPVSEQVSFTFR